MVSWVNSNFAGFGSGITVPGYGFVLHNRGALFTLDPSSPNVIAPHKRPFNTLSAGFVMKDKQPLMTMLLMGGDMQAQGHAQALLNVIDLGANVQAAGEMARFRHSQVANRLELESELYRLVGAPLTQMGHRVGSADGRDALELALDDARATRASSKRSGMAIAKFSRTVCEDRFRHPLTNKPGSRYSDSRSRALPLRVRLPHRGNARSGTSPRRCAASIQTRSDRSRHTENPRGC